MEIWSLLVHVIVFTSTTRILRTRYNYMEVRSSSYKCTNQVWEKLDIWYHIIATHRKCWHQWWRLLTLSLPPVSPPSPLLDGFNLGKARLEMYLYLYLQPCSLNLNYQAHLSTTPRHMATCTTWDDGFSVHRVYCTVCICEMKVCSYPQVSTRIAHGVCYQMGLGKRRLRDVYLPCPQSWPLPELSRRLQRCSGCSLWTGCAARKKVRVYQTLTSSTMNKLSNNQTDPYSRSSHLHIACRSICNQDQLKNW